MTETSELNREDLLQLADQIDGEAAIAARPGQMDRLEEIAKKIRAAVMTNKAVADRAMKALLGVEMDLYSAAHAVRVLDHARLLADSWPRCTCSPIHANECAIAEAGW